MIPFSAFSHKKISVMWTCGESNPGPNKEAIRFLHAYSSLWFSRHGKTWTTNHTLIS